MTFLSLHREGQKTAESDFASVVATSQFKLWNPAEPPPAQGLRILIIAATYVLYTMRLLDRINQTLEDARKNNVQGIHIDLANAATLDLSQDKLREYLPRTRETVPIASYWIDGVFHASAADKAVEPRVMQWIETYAARCYNAPVPVSGQEEHVLTHI